MHGSQYHYQQALTVIRPETAKLAGQFRVNTNCKKDGSKKCSLILLTLLTLSLSSLAFAGPSQPKLKGGNGNANGR